MLRPPFSIVTQRDDHHSLSTPPTSPKTYTSAQTPNITLRDTPPVAYRTGNTLSLIQDNPHTYYTRSLLTPRLNTLSSYLWLAGLPHPARPLHRQKLLGRSILITEDPHEHLVWHKTRIFIKPLPLFLFSYDCWTEILCPDPDLYPAACGFLLSYAWIIQYESDLRLAHALGLLPPTLTWTQWTSFIHNFLRHTDLRTLTSISPRFHYGELRLSRLDKLTFLTAPTFANLLHGFMATSTWYQDFFTRNFAWSLAGFGLMAVALDAMQVVAAVLTKGGPPTAFVKASYSFAVGSLLIVGGGVAVMAAVWSVLFVYYVWRARANDFMVNKERKGM